MLRLLTLIAVAVVPIALVVCAATVLSAADHADCGLGATASHRLARALYLVAAALGFRLIWVLLRLWRAGRAALVRGPAAQAAVPLLLHSERIALVLPLVEPVAYTAGLARPQVVVSRGLLSLLDPGERRALLAHELAHARGGHPRMLFVGAAVAEAYRFLAPVRSLFRSLRRQLEAAADEQALAAVGDRGILARAIAKAALAGAPGGAGALAGASTCANASPDWRTRSRPPEASPLSSPLAPW